MKRILIYGHNSFLAKNFVNNYKDLYEFYYFKFHYNNDKKFKKNLILFIKRNKIRFLINFAANNDNSAKSSNFNSIINSNFYLPVTFIEVSNILKINLILFLSKEIDKNYYVSNFYSLSKLMLKSYIETTNFKCKLKVFNIDSVFGPHDMNHDRLIPSICLNLLKIKKNKKININQKKKLTYVNDVNKAIIQSFNIKKKYYYKEIKSDLYNINKLYRYLKVLANNLNRNNKFYPFVETLKWYKNLYEKKK